MSHLEQFGRYLAHKRAIAKGPKDTNISIACASARNTRFTTCASSKVNTVDSAQEIRAHAPGYSTARVTVFISEYPLDTAEATDYAHSFL